MRILQDHQHRIGSRHLRDRPQHRLEQPFSPELRAEIQIGGGVRQRQQFGQQLEIRASGRAQQVARFGQAPLWVVVTLEAGGTLKLRDHRI